MFTYTHLLPKAGNTTQADLNLPTANFVHRMNYQLIHHLPRSQGSSFRSVLELNVYGCEVMTDDQKV